MGDAADGEAARAVLAEDRGDRDQGEGVGGAVADLAIDVAAANRRGEGDRGDQLARLEIVVDMGRVAGQAIATAMSPG